MKKVLLIAAILLAAFVGRAQGTPEIRYVDASAFPVYGKVTENTSERYTRLPAYLEGQIRQELWDLGRHAAGINIRFRTNSTTIKARWKSTFKFAMNHMTATGVRGLDLYALTDRGCIFVCNARPSTNQETEARIVSNLDGQMREYVLYLALYDGVQDLEIGVDEGAIIEGPAVDWPKREKPVVIYGTSITQGGCANRPGMAWTSILSRRLGREVVNLGFSGNGRLDLEIAKLMAEMPAPGVFVLDNLGNCKVDRIKEGTKPFVKVLRDAHPDVPIVFVEHPIFSYFYFDKVTHDDILLKNKTLHEEYEALKKAGYKKLFYVKADDLNGHDNEGAVDGVHFTDLGMLRCAEAVYPTIKKALKANKN